MALRNRVSIMDTLFIIYLLIYLLILKEFQQVSIVEQLPSYDSFTFQEYVKKS